MNLSAIKALTGENQLDLSIVNSMLIKHKAKMEEALTALEKAAENKNVVGIYLEAGAFGGQNTTSPIYCTADAVNEEPLDELGTIYSRGAYYIGLMSERGALWINSDLLKPVRDDYRRYYARWHEGDHPTIAVYDDLTTCKAIVLPLTPDGAEAVRMDAMKLCAPVARWEIERAKVEWPEAEEMAEQMGIADVE